MTDPIADYLTRLRNAIKANHRVVEVPASNIKKEITKILFEQGYILNYKFENTGTPKGSIKIALKYDPEQNVAPKMVAKGRGHVAENILAAAQKNAIPVYQNKSLVNMLMALELDKEIPTELYTTVAEVLAYVYRIDKRKEPKEKGPRL